MKVKFVGKKHISGTKNNRTFDFDVACFSSEMSERDKQNGSSGLDVHTPAVPERYKDLLVPDNFGKDFELELYWANGRENIGYCALLGK